jgi:hypothetical protein
MPENAICFLRTSGMYMTEDFAWALYRGALEMVEGNLRELEIQAKDVGEANITTDYKVLALGHRGGIKFLVDASIGSRQFKIEFLLDTRYLREFVPGRWSLVGYRPSTLPAASLN